MRLTSDAGEIIRQIGRSERKLLTAFIGYPHSIARSIADGVEKSGAVSPSSLPAQEWFRETLAEHATNGVQAGHAYSGEQLLSYLRKLRAGLPDKATFAAKPVQYRLPLDAEDVDGIIAEHEDITVRPVRGLEWYKTRALELARVTSADLLKEAERRVTDALRAGQGLREIAAGLRETFPAFAKARLENIARTESSHLFNAGRWDFYQQSGAVWGYRFRAIRDERTTQICTSLDGSTFPKGEEAGRVPPLHFQCRSTLDPVLWTEAAAEGWQWKVRDGALPAMTGFGSLPDAG